MRRRPFVRAGSYQNRVGRLIGGAEVMPGKEIPGVLVGCIAAAVQRHRRIAQPNRLDLLAFVACPLNDQVQPIVYYVCKEHRAADPAAPVNHAPRLGWLSDCGIAVCQWVARAFGFGEHVVDKGAERIRQRRAQDELANSGCCEIRRDIGHCGRNELRH